MYTGRDRTEEAAGHKEHRRRGSDERPSQTWGWNSPPVRGLVRSRTPIAIFWFCSPLMFGTVSLPKPVEATGRFGWRDLMKDITCS